MHVTDVMWDEPNGYGRRGYKMEQHTAPLNFRRRFYAAHGFLGYVAGQPKKGAIF
jgi:hypothetical protein